MFTAGNILQNNSLAALSRQAEPRVVNAIQDASRRTGVDFAYLMEKAAAESSFDARAQSRTSSAAGLYQFIESTWLQMVKQHGHEYGLGRYAEQIDDNGRIKNPQLRKEILELRKDPEVAAFLAAELANDNAQYLQRNLDGDYGTIGATEMYFAHFLGAGGATAFLNEYKDNPLATAADLFPKAARANRNVFYDANTGEPRTLAGVYDFFARKFEGSGDNVTSTGMQVKRDRTPASDPAPTRLTGHKAREEMIRQAAQIEHEVLSIISHPVHKKLGRAYENGWKAAPIPAQAGLVRNPAELMLLARLDAPQKYDGEKEPRRAHNRQSRYN